MPPTPSLLAIIPFYKRPDQLEKCRAALAASEYPIEAWVHDNNTDNVGYTRACNLGLRESLRRGHKYAVLLNQDCYVRPDAIGHAVAFMDAHPRCAIAGPKQLIAEDPDQIIHGGCIDAYPLGRHFVGKVSNGDCATSLPMPWVNGACMVVRTEALYDTGLMDEGFFIIASDSDFCFTARQRGWEVWYCAESVVLHETGGVSSQGGGRSLPMMAHFNADQIRFRDKWIGSLGWELLKDVPPPPPSVKRLSNDEVGGAVRAASAHFQKNELPQSEILCRKILAWEPEQPDAHLILGVIYVRSNMPALAARHLQHALAKAPDSANVHTALGDALLSCNQPNDAITHYRRAQSLGLRNPDGHVNLAAALALTGDKPAAIAELRAALALDPRHPVARQRLAEAGITDLPGPPIPAAQAQPNTFGSAAPGAFRIG